MKTIDRLVIINDFSVARGGATAMALLCADMAHRSGLPVTFMTGDDGTDTPLLDKDIDIVALGARSILDQSAAVAVVGGLYNTAVATFEKWVEDHDTPSTIYHLHNWGMILSPSIFRLLRKVGHRTVMHAHDFALVCPTIGFMNFHTGEPCGLVPLSAACLASNCDKRSYLQKLWRVARLVALRGVWDVRRGPGRIILLTEAMRPFFLKSGVRPDVLRVADNPITPYTSERIEAEKNKELLFVGRLEPEKGVVSAARAAQAAGLTLRVFGEGREAAKLASFPNVILEGHKTREEIAEHARNARLLVAPAQWREPFGLVLLEAAMSGLPVVLSDISLLASQVVQHDAGWEVDVTSDEPLTALLRRLATDDEAVARASHAGYDNRTNLGSSTESWWNVMMDIYREMIP